ncbi:MAG: amidohydrolase family protein [Cyclobacteriaceae bacterium]
MKILSIVCVMLLFVQCTNTQVIDCDLVISNVNLISMNEEEVQSNQDVFIKGDVIVLTAKSDGTKLALEGSRIVDGSGKYLMPGLIDMHLHINGKWNFDLLLANGVTSVRNMHGSAKILAWRDSINNGSLQGPEIFTSSPFIHRNPEIRQYGFTIVETEEEARTIVNQFTDEGYRYIIAELDTKPFLALMDEARNRNVPVVGHIPNYEKNLPQVFSEGMLSIEHLMELFWVAFDTVYAEDKVAPFVEMVKSSGTAITPMLIREHNGNQLFDLKSEILTAELENKILHYYGEDRLNAFKERIKEIESGASTRKNEDIPAMLKIVKALSDAGVKLLLGTDAGGITTFHGPSLHHEMNFFAQAGISNYRILLAATKHAAEILGEQETLGTIDAGKSADLVLTTDNPLEILGTLQEPLGVVLNGAWIDFTE